MYGDHDATPGQRQIVVRHASDCSFIRFPTRAIAQPPDIVGTPDSTGSGAVTLVQAAVTRKSTASTKKWDLRIGSAPVQQFKKGAAKGANGMGEWYPSESTRSWIPAAARVSFASYSAGTDALAARAWIRDSSTRAISWAAPSALNISLACSKYEIASSASPISWRSTP